MYKIGDKPGIGSYRDEAGHTITLNSPDLPLSACRRCTFGHLTTWKRVP